MLRANGARPVSRRNFLRTMSASGAAAAVGVTDLSSFLTAPPPASRLTALWDAAEGNPLRTPAEVSPHGLTLSAREGTAHIGDGVVADAWMLNDCLPSPLLRVRKGERFQVTLENHLGDDLILHWHGLTPPAHSDGHPHLAVGRDQSYAYDFTVEDRAGTYWYHSHAHLKVGEHTYRGIGGMILVGDDEEAALRLPSGEREIPIVFQDRNLDPDGRPLFERMDGHLLDGYMGPEPFGNGIHRPQRDVDSGIYRLRLLNGSNARIFHLERSDGQPLVLIGNDGGLIERPLTLPWIEVAPAERLDLLLDLKGVRPGQRVTLRSRAFEVQSEIQRMSQQGEPIDLLSLRVVREAQDEPFRLPERLSRVPLPNPAESKRERTFRLTSSRDLGTRAMMSHQINGRDFDMHSVDEHIPFGQTEIWTLVNDSDFPHPMHIHATHFSVLSRTGGRGQVMPWETGLKDTVLLHPYETVRIALRFSSHRGLFLIHCHNLEHEDVGMMMNIQVD